MEVILIFGVCILISGAIVAFKGTRKKKLKLCHLQDFSCVQKSISSKKVSDKEKIIDYDKLYHKILLKAGYKGGFGDILKTQPKEVKDLNKIWHLHKIRNHLVHEIGNPKGISLFQASNDYKKEVQKLLKQFSA